MKVFSEKLMDEVQEQAKEKKIEVAAYTTLNEYAKDVLKRVEEGVYNPYLVFDDSTAFEELITETECALQIGRDIRRIKHSDTTKKIRDILDDVIEDLTENGLMFRAEIIKKRYKEELLKGVGMANISNQVENGAKKKRCENR